MRNIFKKAAILALVLVVTSCGMLSGDKFVYLGHGEDSPDYQLYYDKTQKLFVLIDKRNGCFQKDDTGTCLAFTLKEAREFREKVLAKMIEIDLRLAKDDYGSYAIAELQKAGITTVNKPIETEDVYATPIRQIVLDRKQQYHLVRREYKLDANLVAMVTTGDDGQKRIKVAYTVDFPGVEKNFNTKLRPFIIDPEYLYTHMTIDAVHEAQYMQRDVLRNQKDVKEEVAHYLSDVVDKEQQIAGDPHEDIANKVSALDGKEIITKADIQAAKAKELSSGSSAPTSAAKEETKDEDPTMTNRTTLGSDNGK
ncbi:hypothetical protein LO80_06705 [Candidatus Francisella endociliophora]|uniref:Lipoprotein n=1 Tax=Candidatus Francisella endociliophora TaxID=653937 RepID=A0A097EQ35_9GAMM|nr:hypothetical protein [Francisella sp. FSC1006]AIT09683.1 hypothetical protein LO80_06705 [Francisella sp. FSC1006]